jgi:excinuclease ABC subunit A
MPCGDRRTVYILDEPTTGLHFADVQHLLQVLHRWLIAALGDRDEHNLDVIKTSDWVIDMGRRWCRGGQVIAQGTPEQVAEWKPRTLGTSSRKFCGS